MIPVIRQIALRFLFCYFLLFFLIGWFGDGGKDTAFRWTLLAGSLVVAAVAGVVWSLLDRGRTGDGRLGRWLRLLLRLSLALALIVDGIAKLFAHQIPPPDLYTFTGRVGELTPGGLLWFFLGISPAFQMFIGSAQLFNGLLLLAPRTTLLGALMCVANMTMGFVLALCYDLPVKILSFHYLIMGAILLAPDLRRLVDVFFFNRPVEPVEERPELDRVPQIVLAVVGLITICISVVVGIQRSGEVHPPRPPFYGAWSVEEFAISGEEVPLATDPDRWRWVFFQQTGTMEVELMIGTRRSYALGRQAFSFQEPEDGVLVLDGRLDGRSIRARLHRMNLIKPRFHWIIELE